MPRESSAIKEAIRERHLTMKQVGRVLATIQGKEPGKRPEATVSQHLRKSKVSAAMAPLLWEAIEECAPSPRPPPVAPQATTAGSKDLAEAIRLLTTCSPAQVAKVIGYIECLLSAR